MARTQVSLIRSLCVAIICQPYLISSCLAEQKHRVSIAPFTSSCHLFAFCDRYHLGQLKGNSLSLSRTRCRLNHLLHSKTCQTATRADCTLWWWWGRTGHWLRRCEVRSSNSNCYRISQCRTCIIICRTQHSSQIFCRANRHLCQSSRKSVAPCKTVVATDIRQRNSFRSSIL